LSETVETPLLWAGFLAFIALMVAIDLGVFHRKTHAVSIKEASIWSVAWFTLAMCFAGIVYFLPNYGAQASQEFLTGYILELALSVDNLFVFILIFGTFAVPDAYQHRVLIWGILGAILLRGAFILAGTAIVERFHWVLYIFGLILLYTGGKLLFSGDDDEKPDLEQTRTVRVVRWLLRGRLTSTYRKDRFFTVENGVRMATPLLLVLCIVEVSDLIFALDSIPAIFAITTRPFVVFTSNMFAILGLRNLFFVLNNLLGLFRLLKYGVALVLVFIALKILSMDLIHHLGLSQIVITQISLGVVATLLIGSIVLSKLIPEKKEEPAPEAKDETKAPADAKPSE
jgi:tellurite resistance protein TerC